MIIRLGFTGKLFQRSSRPNITTIRWISETPTKNTEIPTKNQLTSNAHSARYCMELVRRNDYENFLCTLLVDGAQRQSAIAIRAFNVEVANIASVVSDDKIGAMRLHFWHNAVKTVFETSPQTIPDHPVVRELHRLIAHSPIRPQRLHFTRLIKARERPAHQGFVTVKALEQYAEESTSCNLYLLASVAGVNNMDVDHALSHLGKAHGIVNMLRAQAVQRTRRSAAFCVFPQETLMKHGVSQERALRDAPNDAGVRECTFEVASVAHSHLENARKLSPKVPDPVKRLLLPAVAVDRYLERLRRVDFHLSDPRLASRDSMLPFWYYWNYWRNKY